MSERTHRRTSSQTPYKPESPGTLPSVTPGAHLSRRAHVYTHGPDPKGMTEECRDPLPLVPRDPPRTQVSSTQSRPSCRKSCHRECHRGPGPPSAAPGGSPVPPSTAPGLSSVTEGGSPVVAGGVDPRTPLVCKNSGRGLDGPVSGAPPGRPLGMCPSQPSPTGVALADASHSRGRGRARRGASTVLTAPHRTCGLPDLVGVH